MNRKNISFAPRGRNYAVRSDRYQYLYRETCSFDDYMVNDSYQLQFTNDDIKDKVNDLNEQLLNTMMELAKDKLTQHQMNILQLLLKGYTQGEIADELGGGKQSSISKAIYGNTDYADNKKIYGGFWKKLKAMNTHPRIVPILNELRKLNNEEYSFSELYKTQIRKTMKVCCKCNKEKPFADFSRNSNPNSSSDGYQAQCKLCASEYSKLYTQKRKAQNQILKLLTPPMGVTQPEEPKASVIVSQEPQKVIPEPKDDTSTVVIDSWDQQDPAQLVYHYKFYRAKRDKYQEKMNQVKEKILKELE